MRNLSVAEGHCVDAEVTPAVPGGPASRHRIDICWLTDEMNEQLGY